VFEAFLKFKSEVILSCINEMIVSKIYEFKVLSDSL
jgi:hypothetical protein